MNNLNTIQRITSELTKIFDALNDHYFESSLPPVVITITPGKSKATSFYGRFTAETWAEIKDVNVNEKLQRYQEMADRQNASQPYRSRDKGAR